MEDIRKTWFKDLSKDAAIEANECLVTISDIEAVDGGPTYEEVKEIHKALTKFKEITDLEARDILDSFLEYGWCYGTDFLPYSYFKEGEQDVAR